MDTKRSTQLTLAAAIGMAASMNPLALSSLPYIPSKREKIVTAADKERIAAAEAKRARKAAKFSKTKA